MAKWIENTIFIAPSLVTRERALDVAAENREGVPVPLTARFVHVNLIARDWRRLVDFYVRVFGCRAVPPERHLSGDWLERSTGVPGARISGMHLRLPGSSSDENAGPTLEIFSYEPAGERPVEVAAANRPGFGHLAFAVEDVVAARDAVLAAGGGSVGEIVSREIPGAGHLTFCYVTDPEGNILELQRWN